MGTRTATLWPELTVEPPIVSGPLSVYPLIDGAAREPDDYLLLGDALDMGLVRVDEVGAAGVVPVLRVENTAKLPVLAVQGEEFRGAKQNRTLNATILLAPGKHEIPVTCVEQGRWHFTSPHFTKGNFEHADLRRLKIEMLDEQLRQERAMRGRGYRAEFRTQAHRYSTDQGAVWREVQVESCRHHVQSPSQALSDVYEDRSTRKSLDDMIADVKLPPKTRGVAVAFAGKLSAGEVMESGEVFARVWPRLSRSYALSALGRGEGPAPARAAVAEFLRRVVEADGTEVARSESVGLGEDVRWKGRGFTGAGLAWKERLLHGVVFCDGVR